MDFLQIRFHSQVYCDEDSSPVGRSAGAVIFYEPVVAIIAAAILVFTASV